MNKEKIVIPRSGTHGIYEFDVAGGETVDFQVAVTTDQGGVNNSLWLILYQDGKKVAASVDDSETKGDDNASLTLIYKAKAREGGSNFELKAQGSTANRVIPATQMQVGYKTYGPGHMLSVL